MVRSTLIATLLLFLLAGWTQAGVIEVNLSAPVSSGEYIVNGPTSQEVQYSLTAPAFTVNEGDTVRVTLMFKTGGRSACSSTRWGLP